MQGTIISYRRGRHTQNTNQMLVRIENVSTKEQAEEYVGKHIVWITPSNKEMPGKIIAVHGSKGAVRAKFEKNLPGQSIASKVMIL